MNQINLSMVSQARDLELNRLTNLERFKGNLEILQNDELAIIKEACLTSGIGAHDAAARMVRAGGATALLAHIPAWIAEQSRRVDGAEAKLRTAAAQWKASREVEREDTARLTEALSGVGTSDAEVKAVQKAEHIAKHQRIAAKVAAATQGIIHAL